jgi:hypothetical protein
MAHAFRAEPLAVRDGRQGWGEARVMIRLIALCARARVVGTIKGKRATEVEAYLIAREWVAVIFVAYHALVRRV